MEVSNETSDMCMCVCMCVCVCVCVCCACMHVCIWFIHVSMTPASNTTAITANGTETEAVNSVIVIVAEQNKVREGCVRATQSPPHLPPHPSPPSPLFRVEC